MLEAVLTSAPAAQSELAPAARRALALQRTVGWLLAPLWLPLVGAMLHLGFGYRIVGRAALRRQYAELWRARPGPLLICANHLTMIDSALIAWALGSPWWYVRHFAAVPWNVPERQHFAASLAARILVYVMKCLPITRGGSRAEVSATLQRFAGLLAAGDAGLIFPEGGRSRSGRVEVEAAAYGVGRIVRSLPGCRVLCVYLRGERQETYSDIPQRGDRFHVRLQLLHPRSLSQGIRGDRDVALQIVRQLAAMERQYFDDRQRRSGSA